MDFVDTIIVSDIHLGLKICKSRLLVETLNKYRDGNTYLFNRIILDGDIFEDIRFIHEQHKGHMGREFISFIQSTKQAGKEVVWVRGNHNNDVAILVAHMLGSQLVNGYEWQYKGNKYLALHGHQFDWLISQSIYFNEAVIQWSLPIQNQFPKTSHFFTTCAAKWFKLYNKVKDDAFKYATEEGFNGVFAGHTHFPELEQREGIWYGNSGSWVAPTCSYLTVDEIPKLHLIQS